MIRNLNKILPFIFSTLLYSQWAMWANPSLPVGNSDQGVGLAPGEIMIFGDYSYQSFDWWHEKIDDALATNGSPEWFEHSGMLINKTLNVGATLGIGEKWNMTFSQIISERCMEWEGPVDASGNSYTVHHRSECSSEDFIDNGEVKAYGGYFGDATLSF